jgi:hypothetical protein
VVAAPQVMTMSVAQQAADSANSGLLIDQLNLN